jgi:tetratricopeptide (TPR) repeat protein
LTLALLAAAPVAPAQSYVMKDGTSLPAADVTLGAGFLSQQVRLPSGGSFERRFPLEDIARMEVPEPAELTEAERLVAAGSAAEALALLEPLHQRFAPFARVPGSPWPRVAGLRLQALLDAKDERAADAARELMRSGLDAETTGPAKLVLARLDADAGRDELAAIMIEEVLKDAPPAVQARAWLLRGDLAARRAAHEEALEAYLRVPAFFGTFDELMPAALLGAARSYRAYGDTGRAERAALELIDGYPNSAQAAEARRDFGF